MKNFKENKELIEQIIIQNYKVHKEQEQLKNLKDKMVASLIWDGFDSSYIQTSLGTVSIKKIQKSFFYTLLSKDFNKLDYSLKKEFFNKKLTKVSFRINQNVYRESLENKSIPPILLNLVVPKEREPFLISVMKRNDEEIEKRISNIKNQSTEINENDAQEHLLNKDDDDNDHDDDYIYETDSTYFTDDDIADTSIVDKEYKGL